MAKRGQISNSFFEESIGCDIIVSCSSENDFDNTPCTLLGYDEYTILLSVADVHTLVFKHSIDYIYAC